jgi:hypothetical protein
MSARIPSIKLYFPIVPLLDFVKFGPFSWGTSSLDFDPV